MRKKKQTWKWVLLGVVLVAIAGLVAIGLSKLFESKETYIIEDSGTERLDVLVCEAQNPQEAFFAPEGATDVQHEIKLLYTGEDVNKISYTYDADFGSPDAVTAAEAEVHADYNIFMGKYIDDFSEQFMPMGDELKISVVADAENLGSETSRIFFINTDEFNQLNGFKVKDMAEIFKRKGFSCEYDND